MRAHSSSKIMQLTNKMYAVTFCMISFLLPLYALFQVLFLVLLVQAHTVLHPQTSHTNLHLLYCPHIYLFLVHFHDDLFLFLYLSIVSPRYSFTTIYFTMTY